MAQSDQYKNESGITIFFLYILQTITVSIEVFIRYKMGERYMTVLRTLWLFSFFVLFIISMDIFIDAFNTNLMGLFIIASMGLALTHAIRARRRYSKNIEIHSYYNGIPVLKSWFPNKSETTIKNYIEPLVLLCLGVSLFVFGRYFFYEVYGLGLYIVVVSIVLFVKAQIEYSIGRNRYLDIMDKKIEGEMLKDAIQGKDAAKTKGFSLPVPKQLQPATRDSVEQMYRTLDPSLQRLINNTIQKEPSLEISRTPIELSKEPSKEHDVDKNDELERDL